MPANLRRIGVLTGGGDCPGLNAVIRAVTKTAILRHQLDVFGIEDGFQGLIQNRIRPLLSDDVSNILTQGGTILGTNNKCDPRRYAVPDAAGKPVFLDVTDRCMEHFRLHQLDALIVIGGDGTMAVASHFVRQGINCIGVPKTIDNDLEGTDVTFGFATAVQVAAEALDRVHTTAASHHRAMIVEVMGRNAGWIALHAGVASGADVILIPEIPYSMDAVCRKVVDRSRHGKRFTILCVSEGAKPAGGRQVVRKVDPTSPDPIRLGGVGQVIADQIEQQTGIETRCTVLGHVQRGGTPVPDDRVLATQFGHAAFQALMSGKQNRLVVMKGRTVTDVDLLSIEGKQRLVPLEHPLVVSAKDVGTCFGE
ncbi:MAG: ATP-dependent 6-phosphofructokinase [Phycisphaeraceae bacterium]|nr:ATP-dependent 6-phosphofructokinase [Phycisphaeraceae bacterium]